MERLRLEGGQRRLWDLQRRGRGERGAAAKIGRGLVVHGRREQWDASTCPVLAEVVEHMGELDSRADKVMAQDQRCMRAFRPVRALLPCLDNRARAAAGSDAERNAGRPGRDNVLEVELRGLREHKSRETFARVEGLELGVRDRIERNLHLESVSRGMDEPG